MENIIFAALLYVLVPAFLLWINYESSLRNKFVVPQSSNHASTIELPQLAIALGNNPAHNQSGLITSDRTRSNQNVNPIQKTSKNQALPKIKKHESKDTKTDYHQLTIRQLKNIAQKKKIKRYGNMRKQDLILALTS